jgi:hypothetical protein
MLYSNSLFSSWNYEKKSLKGFTYNYYIPKWSKKAKLLLKGN